MSTANVRYFVALASAAFSMCAGAATVQVSLTPLAARPEAPVYHLTDASGRSRSLADDRGKVVVLNFWATDCGGCRLEIPWFVELNKSLDKRNVALIGISVDIPYEDLKSARDAWARVKPFVKAQDIEYPILMGDDETMKRFNITALPVTYLIDSHGRIAATYVGLIDKQNVETNVHALLAEK